MTLKALSLQLAGLLDEAGGDHALKLLDGLASLNPQARSELLEKFQAQLAEVAKHESNNYQPGVEEDKLFNSILEEVESGKIFSGKRFQVLNGPQSQEHLAEVIDLQAFRRKNKQ